jgi:hypothetical protein
MDLDPAMVSLVGVLFLLILVVNTFINAAILCLIVDP